MDVPYVASVAAALMISVIAPRATGQTRFATLYAFTDGYPAGLTVARGALYGAFEGIAPTGANCGTVFELSPPAVAGGAWAETVLHSFAGTPDACDPLFPPVVGPGGTVYGVTYEGGADQGGALYELIPPASPDGDWSESLPYSFGETTDGGYDESALVPRSDGSFYLLTSSGTNGYGALFQLRPPTAAGGAWTGTVLYSFPVGQPVGTLIAGPDGSFYGTSFFNLPGPGLIFRLSPPTTPGGAWTESEVYNLVRPYQQGSTLNSLVLASDGTIYGTTYGDSMYAGGISVVFQLTPPSSPGGEWTYTKLREFERGNLCQPLILRNGNLYGAVATSQGGAVFEMQPPSSPGGAWTTTYLHAFTDGQVPGAALVGGAFVMDEHGTIFGATQNVYAQPPNGTVYAISPE